MVEMPMFNMSLAASDAPKLKTGGSEYGEEEKDILRAMGLWNDDGGSEVSAEA